MSNVVTHYGEEKTKSKSTLFLTEDRLKTKSQDQGQKSSSIYKQNDEVLYTIDHRNERYTKITKENIEQMEQMMERMENLPESSKKMMKDKMGGMMQNEQPKIEYEKTGETKEIEPWGTCEEWEGHDEDGNMREKVYTTERKELKLQEAHFDVLTDMIDFFSFLPEDMDKKLPVKTKGEQKGDLKGFGVSFLYFDEDGNKTQRVRVKEMKKTEFDESTFEVPSDYEGSEMNMGGGRR